MRNRFAPFSCLLLCVLLPACDDDSDIIDGPFLWEQVAVTDAPAYGEFRDVAFSSGRGIVVGFAASPPPGELISPVLYQRNPGEDWRPLISATFPSTGAATAAGFAPDGERLVGEVRPDGAGFVLDERGGWNAVGVDVAPLAFAAGGGVVRVAGRTTGASPVLASGAADTWIPESLPFGDEFSDRGIEDLAARDGIFYACGYDDGGDGTPESPFRVLFRNEGSGWNRLDTPCGGCENREFLAVAVTSAGGLFLGGAVTDFSAGATDDYVAFLLLRSPSGDWTGVVLPDPGSLDRVNDILVARDGTVYLACGIDAFTAVVSAPGGPFRRDETVEGAYVHRLAEASDGSIWAAGRVAAGRDGATRPVLLVR